LASKLQNLQEKYGVDGYKHDGGDAKYVSPDYLTYAGKGSNLTTDYWAKFGELFAYNEYRVSWLTQSSGLVQRLRDKKYSWSEENGLGSLVTHSMGISLIGYPFFSPDLIGGGEGKDFRNSEFKGMDDELFVRWTQASALMPMMQFSYAPWKLTKQSVDICRKYAQLHEQLGDYIYALACKSSQTGDPIIKPLFYDNPLDEDAYLISDEFLLGERILVAPVLKQGIVTRDIYLPEGTWNDFWSGTLYEGGITLKNYPAPLETLPIFIKVND
jgi:alpha-glucosidase (family GH31 glycosyl hydrolase)